MAFGWLLLPRLRHLHDLVPSGEPLLPEKAQVGTSLGSCNGEPNEFDAGRDVCQQEHEWQQDDGRTR